MSLSFAQLELVFPDGTQALAGIDLQLPPGSFTVLVGPSGCGKSTLLRLAAGLIEPTHGRVERPAGLQQGFVFQRPELLPWRSVIDNVALPLELQGVRRAERQRAARAQLEQVGLAGFETHLPHELSGGMRMRTALARALTGASAGPDAAGSGLLLLLDEPFAALDELTRHQLQLQLLELWRTRRATVLFVTHSIFEAAFLADQVLVLGPRPGRLVARVEVALPRPRVAALRADPGFAAVVGRISQALHAAPV